MGLLRMEKAQTGVSWNVPQSGVMQTDGETLGRILVQYRVALQPNRHPAI